LLDGAALRVAAQLAVADDDKNYGVLMGTM
jgi:hypothetical protein